MKQQTKHEIDSSGLVHTHPVHYITFTEASTHKDVLSVSLFAKDQRRGEQRIAVTWGAAAAKVGFRSVKELRVSNACEVLGGVKATHAEACAGGREGGRAGRRRGARKGRMEGEMLMCMCVCVYVCVYVCVNGKRYVARRGGGNHENWQ